ncbi:MAG TPA: MMPL family transporter [Rhodocyclaceae bacterium]|nr:MMPL family transporter [Rhodocyclaceae bacterium]HMV54413.1 MMPL family transporter [Rhodocyclaceae bacterium]HMZ83306.1 MMPL family transporter [Rhodocyclaceae bacterium]HNA05053.1 MMPL family transporter [Rhodocyclaceae bacterium]HNC62241.1 MMPL family transporter [Rhodocyclaceae bacterium]
MKGSSRVALTIWIAAIAACLWIVANARYTADLSAFLPKTPSREQQVLVNQLRDGAVSRLILIGLEGADMPARTALSRALAARLRGDEQFAMVANGEPVGLDRERDILLKHRYLLSPSVTPERFTEAGLRDAIGETLDLLSSSAGLLAKALVPRDPTGELTQLLMGEFGGGTRGESENGVWVSRDRQRALMLVHTRATGADTDAQAAAIATVRSAFEDEVRRSGIQGVQLLMTGPGVFAVEARATIQAEVKRLAVLSTVLIATLLLIVYRSLSGLMLGLLPVACGALAAVTAVALGHEVVHGVTLGFGTTLIGEAVDYSIYLFVQSERGRDADWISEFWPTIRLGVLTSVCGFAALMFSGFPGLAQLGLYSICGLVAAAAVTRFVLPVLLPDSLRIRDLTPLGLRLAAAVRRAGRIKPLVYLLVVVAASVIVSKRDVIWNRELGALSPVPQAAQDLDGRLRADIGAPDTRNMIVVLASTEEGALVGAERVGLRLKALMDKGVIAGFETPSRYLPSRATQQMRRDSLPDARELADRLERATDGLPLRADKLAPFLADVETARAGPLLSRDDLVRTSFGLAVDSMLVRSENAWSALIPLQAPDSGPSAFVVDADRVRQAIAGTDATFVDLKVESDRLYGSYLGEAILQSAAGVAAILLLLSFSLRSAARVLRVALPLVAAVLVVVAGLALAGVKLHIMHLVGLLLIVAVGSNYALFFDNVDRRQGLAPRMLASLLLANITTVIGFGLLAFSSVPVLNAIGASVGPGAVLALIFSAVLASPGRAAIR